MAAKRVCAFCQQTAKLTGEHLVADWFDKLLTRKTKHYVFTDRNRIDGSVRQFSGRHLDQTVKCVCDNCNNRWMSDIDKEARDVLKDVILYRAPVSFLASGLKSIDRFTMKNALVGDYMSHRPFFSERQRRQFKESRELPPGIYAWFGGVVTERGRRHGIYKAAYGKPATDVRRGVNTYVFTWSTECLLLQLVALRWTNLLDQSRGWPRLTQRCIKMNTAMCPFWPIPVSRRATWPPQQYISHNDLDDVADRFTGVRFTRIPWWETM